MWRSGWRYATICPTRSRSDWRRRSLQILRGIDAPTVLVSGEKLAERAFADQAIRDAAVGESIALVALFVTLIVILGGVVAALLPLLVALGAIAAAFLGLVGLTAVTPVSEFAINVVTLLGIALAVDYTIVLMYRFREERAAEPEADPSELIGRTMATAGRAVLISGLAVTSAMAGLAVFAEPLLASIAQGGAIVALLATAAALTAAPALLGVTHRRVPAADATTWVRQIVRRLRGAFAPKAATGGGRWDACARWPNTPNAVPGRSRLLLPVDCSCWRYRFSRSTSATRTPGRCRPRWRPGRPTT